MMIFVLHIMFLFFSHMYCVVKLFCLLCFSVWCCMMKILAQAIMARVCVSIPFVFPTHSFWYGSGGWSCRCDSMQLWCDVTPMRSRRLMWCEADDWCDAMPKIVVMRSEVKRWGVFSLFPIFFCLLSFFLSNWILIWEVIDVSRTRDTRGEIEIHSYHLILLSLRGRDVHHLLFVHVITPRWTRRG